MRAINLPRSPDAVLCAVRGGGGRERGREREKENAHTTRAPLADNPGLVTPYQASQGARRPGLKERPALQDRPRTPVSLVRKPTKIDPGPGVATSSRAALPQPHPRSEVYLTRPCMSWAHYWWCAGPPLFHARVATSSLRPHPLCRWRSTRAAAQV